MKRVHVLISGDVQGVGFRWFCREQALAQGVNGWVRNLPDGRVEAVFEGESPAVDALVQWCREGTSWATVRDVEAIEESPAGDSGFTIGH